MSEVTHGNMVLPCMTSSGCLHLVEREERGISLLRRRGDSGALRPER